MKNRLYMTAEEYKELFGLDFDTRPYAIVERTKKGLEVISPQTGEVKEYVESGAVGKKSPRNAAAVAG